MKVDLAELAAPELGLAKRALPYVLGVVAFVAALLALRFVVGMVTGDKPAQQAAQAELDGRVFGSERDSQEFAATKMIERGHTDAAIKEKEIEYVQTIRSAPGAETPVPPALHDAGIAALRGLRDASGEHTGDGAAVSPSGS